MSFKYGYMAQRSALSQPGMNGAGDFWRKKREQSCSIVQPTPAFSSNFWPIASAPCKRLDSSASRDQVNNGDNQGDHKQEMDQTAGHVESPAQKPKDNEDCKNRPKHRYPFKIGNSVRQPPKGEKRHLRAELSLERSVFRKAGVRTPPEQCPSELLDARSETLLPDQAKILGLGEAGITLPQAGAGMDEGSSARSRILSACDTKWSCRCQALARS